MVIVVMGWDGPSALKGRERYRTEHRERLKQKDHEGRLILAGPFSDGSGSLLIFEAESVEEIQKFMEEDPYVKYRVFDRIEIRPLTPVFPEGVRG